MKTIIITLFLAFLNLSCKPQKEGPDPTIPQKSIITVDVQREIKVLHGNEVGINLNYLMDDAYLSGMTYHSTVNSLKETGVKILRYPGGEKSDNYFFSTPPYDKAKPVAAYCNWPATESRFFNNDLTAKSLVLDFDEYMTVCQQLEATPLVVVTYDAMYSTSTCGTKPTRNELLKNAMEWVRYANIKNSYNVKLWMIGNESWNDPGYNGKVTPQQYAQDIAQFADSMRKVDPSIKIVANGRNDWWQTLLQSNASSKIDFLALSNYLPWKVITSYETFATGAGDVILETNDAIGAISKYAKEPDKNRIKVILAEYSSTDWSKGWPSINNLGHALANFQQLADAITKPEVYAACLWNTRWVDNTSNSYYLNDAFDATGKLNASGKALSVLGKNILKLVVEANSSSNTINAYAMYDKDKNFLNIFLLNKNKAEQEIDLNISNYLSNYEYQLWHFKGTGIDDKNPLWGKEGSFNKGSAGPTFVLPSNSVTMIQIKGAGKF